MAKQKFNIFGGAAPSISAGEELKKLESSQQTGMQTKIIPFEDIEPNILNDYPITDIEELAEEIETYGLISYPSVIPNPEGSEYKYRLYNGERRYCAIGHLLKQGNTTFSKGIPCIIDLNEMDAVEEEIKLILANKQREMTEEFKRSKIKRLNELYKIKAERSGQEINITKKLSKDFGVGERQIQRYTAVNNKLIPELQKAFDDMKITLEKAAQYANMDEQTQKLILEALDIKSNFSKEEIEHLKNTVAEKDKFLSEKQKILETEKENAEITLLSLKSDLETKENELQQREANELILRKKIEDELKQNNPNTEKINSLENSILKIKQDSEELRTMYDTSTKELQLKNKELESIKKQLQEKESANKPLLDEEDKKRLLEEYELENMLTDLKKRYIQYSTKKENYQNSHSNIPENIISKETEFKNILSKAY